LGELVVVTGDTSAGKTQWVLNAVWLQATTGRAAAVFSFENPAEDANMILLGMEAGGDPLTVSHDVFDKAYRSLDAKPITLFDHYGEIGLSQLKESVYFAARRCMAEVVVLDHLHFFLEVPDPRYERQAIDRAMREIKLWAKDLHVLILLVSHPRQTRSDSEKVDMSDLKGSSSIKQDADVVLRVWRKRTVDRTQKGAPCGYVTVLKCRKRYGQEGTVCLAFDQRSGRFSDEIGGAGSAAW
jgi:replicative DNA helicase